MSATPYSSRRRRRTLRPWAANTLFAATFIALGAGLSHIWPWGFAPPPPLPEREPRIGDVVCVEGTCAYLQAVLEVPDDGRVVAVRWLRGKVGAEALRVSDCTAGTGVVEPLAGGERRKWERGGRGIVDLIAAAACGPQSADSGA